MDQYIASHPQEPTMEIIAAQDLLKQVNVFLDRSTLFLTPQFRILDICSEFGEVFDSLSGNGDLSEEVGDLLYSSLALCCELGIRNFTVNPDKGIGPEDLARSLGRLSKESLKATDYGKDTQTIVVTDGLRVSANDFATKVIQFAIDKMVDPSTALTLVFTKYESRLKRTNSAGSGS